MRAMRVVVVGVSVLLGGSAAVDCSSTPDTTPYDAGALFDDAGFGVDPFTPDARLAPDAADAAARSDAPEPASDGSEDAVAADSSIVPDDASAEGSDGSDSAPAADASEGSVVADASDASFHWEDAGTISAADAGDAAAADAEGIDAADAADASGAAPSADDAGPSFDAAACSGFNLSGDAISGIAVATSPDDGVAFDTGATNPATNAIPAADAVVVTVTTSPIGVMEDLAVDYFTGASGPTASIALSLVAALPGATNQTWHASIPAMPAGTQVQFWVVGHDYCKTNAEAGADYYSNSGGNYHYETE